MNTSAEVIESVPRLRVEGSGREPSPSKNPVEGWGLEGHRG
jgi:hypothetical protein